MKKGATIKQDILEKYESHKDVQAILEGTSGKYIVFLLEGAYYSLEIN